MYIMKPEDIYQIKPGVLIELRDDGPFGYGSTRPDITALVIDVHAASGRLFEKDYIGCHVDISVLVGETLMILESMETAVYGLFWSLLPLDKKTVETYSILKIVNDTQAG